MRYLAGINTILTALDNRVDFVCLYIDEKKSQNKRIKLIIDKAKALSIMVELKDKVQLDLMLVGVKNQGVVATINEAEQALTLDQVLQRESPTILILDGVLDPHNLGACLRSAAAAEVDAVVLPKNNACSITPVVSRVAAGGAEIVPVFYETNLSRFLKACQKSGLWSIALTGYGGDNFYQLDLKGPSVFIMGGEEQGVSKKLLELSDYQAKIPISSKIESLNVSVATALVLFEQKRQKMN